MTQLSIYFLFSVAVCRLLSFIIAVGVGYSDSSNPVKIPENRVDRDNGYGAILFSGFELLKIVKYRNINIGAE
jgi:hypothetical protein